MIRRNRSPEGNLSTSEQMIREIADNQIHSSIRKTKYHANVTDAKAPHQTCHQE